MRALRNAGMLLAFIILNTPFAFSQCTGTCGGNLLPNPGFESATPFCNTMLPPDDRQHLYTNQTPVQSWYGTAATPLVTINSGTPDYLSPCGQSLLMAYNCISGSAAIGIHTYSDYPGLPVDFRENIQAQLLSPLIAGKTYCFSMKVSSDKGSSFSDGIGAWFHNMGMIDETTMNGGLTFFGPGSVINANPQIENTPGNSIDSTCKIITGTFCAQGGEEWIMIGNFKSNANTACLMNLGSPAFSYISIDDVSLYEVCQNASVTASAASMLCGQSTTITAAVNGNNPGATFTWSASNGDLLTGPGPHVVSPVDTTTYQVIVSGPSICIPDTATITLNVYCSVYTSINDTTLCSGECFNMLAGPTLGGVPPFTYTWIPAIGSGAGPYSICPSATTIYSLTVTDVNGFSYTDSAVVTVNPLPTLYAGADDSICAGEAVTLTGTTSSTAFQWLQGPATLNYTVSPAFTTGYYFIAGSNGCTAMDTVRVHVFPLPVSGISSGPSIFEDDLPAEIINSSTGADSCFLDFGDGTYVTGCYGVTEHFFPGTGTYTLTQMVINNYGCADTSNIPVEVKPLSTLWVPNAFTPNNNGNNELFSAKGLEVSEFSMMIFNRWGEKIFESNDMQKGWDGTFQKKQAEQDTYVWVIRYRDYKNNPQQLRGIVTLIK